MAKPAPTFYVFHGTDEFTRAETLAGLKKRLGPPDTVDLNTTLLEGKDVTVGDLHHACDTVPFLAEKRLVVVTNLLTRLVPRGRDKPSAPQRAFLEELTGYLVNLPETTRLIFVENKPLPNSHPILSLAQRSDRGYAKRFDPPQDAALHHWIRERARRYDSAIEPRAAHHLAALVGVNLRLLDQEIHKLATYTNQQSAISIADIDALVPYAQSAVVWDLVDAVGQQDDRAAAQALHRLLDSGEHPLLLLTMIARQFRLLILVTELRASGATVELCAKALKLHPYPVRKLYKQAARFTAAQLEAVYRHLLDTDVSIKTGELDPEPALDLLMAEVTASP